MSILIAFPLTCLLHEDTTIHANRISTAGVPRMAWPVGSIFDLWTTGETLAGNGEPQQFKARHQSLLYAVALKREPATAITWHEERSQFSATSMPPVRCLTVSGALAVTLAVVGTLAGLYAGAHLSRLAGWADLEVLAAGSIRLPAPNKRRPLRATWPESLHRLSAPGTLPAQRLGG
jgi:hypothetical protein